MNLRGIREAFAKTALYGVNGKGNFSEDSRIRIVFIQPADRVSFF